MKMKIAFDIDDTLIIPSVATGFDRDTPNYEMINLYKWFESQGHYMIIWSGGGVDYAKQ
jgi:phosphoserine phosphatase